MVPLQFIKAVSEGMVAYLLQLPDLQHTAPRVVCRELLAACVLRPLLMYATPYYANKALYAVLQEARQVRCSKHQHLPLLLPNRRPYTSGLLQQLP